MCLLTTSSSVADASDVCHQIFVNSYAIDGLSLTQALSVMYFLKDCVPHLTLMPTTMIIKVWDNFLMPVLGEVECHVRYRSHDMKALFL